MLREKKQKYLNSVDIFAIKATKWIGSTESLIAHTILFIISFLLVLFGVKFERVLLVLTTIVSLEAIYLSIFIQMSVNRTTRRLHMVSKDIDELQKDVEEIGEDVEEIQKDVEEISEDVEDIQEGVESIEKDVDELQKGVEEISEDVEEISEDDEKEAKKEARERKDDIERFLRIEESLETLLDEVKKIKIKK
jgi:uncharacterized protein YoxC